MIKHNRPVQVTETQATRLWEVDTLRGIAIVLMIIYHFVWDLVFFDLYQANVLAGPWQWFARGIATTFLFVMGVSLTLSAARYERKTGRPVPFAKYLRRG
ncbi:MAG: heparan-alpha-glucosaminide N-acetyltransferase domain-containing protein, partial [Anaerolineae bacterium]|nr:heparan-alpha-glucosaminide N-acetyltransferase domain-containing protein [Anaerolineae bacterium]